MIGEPIVRCDILLLSLSPTRRANKPIKHVRSVTTVQYQAGEEENLDNMGRIMAVRVL